MPCVMNIKYATGNGESQCYGAARKRAEEVAEAERKRLEEIWADDGRKKWTSYFNALEENGESRMRDIVNEAARRKGYVSGWI